MDAQTAALQKLGLWVYNQTDKDDNQTDGRTDRNFKTPWVSANSANSGFVIN